jgi:hypothetical protein
MTEEDNKRLKCLIISANALLSEITRRFDDIDSMQEISDDISQKVGAALTVLKAIVDLLALRHGDITGKELKHESDL